MFSKLFGGQVKILNKLKEQISVLLLRFLGLFGKFFSFYLVSKYLKVSDLSGYVLFTGSVTILIYVLGFELYTYSTRLLIAEEDIQNRKKIVLNQFKYYLIVYLLFASVIFVIEVFYPLTNGIYLLLIAILEHTCQEVYRILIAIKKQLLANVLLFIKSGLWVYVLFLFIQFGDLKGFNLDLVYSFWLVSAFITAIVGLAYLFRIYFVIDTPKSTIYSFDYNWYKRGFKSTIIYLGIAIIVKLIEYGNRYFSFAFLNEINVAELGMIFQLVLPITILIDSTILAYIFPEILICITKADINGVKEKIKSSFRSILLLFLGYSIFIIISYEQILIIFNKPELRLETGHFVLALGIALFQNITALLQIPLYGLSLDSNLLRIYGVSFMFYLALGFLLIGYSSIYGIIIASLISAIVLTTMIGFYYLVIFRYDKGHFRHSN